MKSEIKSINTKEKLINLLLLIILLLGLTFAIRDYFAFRSFWTDEAALALNLERSFKELVQPLGSGQMAPIFFLFLAKLLSLLFGLKDYILKIVPLLFGVGSLLLFLIISKKLLPKIHTAFALSFFILSERMLNYFTEFKQYSAEIFFALLLFLFYLNLSSQNINDNNTVLYKTKFIVFIVLGIISIGFSFTAPVVLVSILILLLKDLFFKKDIKANIKNKADIKKYKIKKYKIVSVINYIFISFFWILSIFIFYFYNRQNNSQVSYMNNYWNFAFFPIIPRNTSQLFWLPNSIIDFFNYFYKIDGGLISKDLILIKIIFGFILLLLFIIGIIKYFNKPNNLAIFTFSLIFISLSLSALKIYPFYQRTILYLASFIILNMANGLGFIIDFLNNKKKYLKNFNLFLISIILVFLFAIPFIIRVYYFIEPKYRSEIKPFINYCINNKKENDAILVQEIYLNQFVFYYNKKTHDNKNIIFFKNLLKKDLNNMLNENKNLWIFCDNKTSAIIKSYFDKTFSEKIIITNVSNFQCSYSSINIDKKSNKVFIKQFEIITLAKNISKKIQNEKIKSKIYNFNNPGIEMLLIY